MRTIPRCDLACLNCASYFEFNVDGDTWRRLYVENGGTDDMARHMWDKFADERHPHSILHVIGNADFEQGAIITRMVGQWCREHDNPYDSSGYSLPPWQKKVALELRR